MHTSGLRLQCSKLEGKIEALGAALALENWGEGRQAFEIGVLNAERIDLIERRLDKIEQQLSGFIT